MIAEKTHPEKPPFSLKHPPRPDRPPVTGRGGPQPDEKKVEFKVYLTPQEAAQMRAFCASRSLPMSVFMRQVITRFMERQLSLAMTRAQDKVRQGKLDEALARLDTI